MKFKVVDLFCDGGGFAIGIDMDLNFQSALGVDFNKFAIKMFNINFPNGKIICDDLRY